MSEQLSSSNKRRKIVGSTFVGEKPKEVYGEIQTIRFQIADFTNRSEKRGERFKTGNVKAHGHSWYLIVFPRGNSQSNPGTEYISLFLGYTGEAKNVYVGCTWRLQSFINRVMPICDFGKDSKSLEWGYQDFVKRKDLPSYIDKDGTLTIEVDIQLARDKDAKVFWYPKTLQQEPTLVECFKSSTFSDVTFVIGRERYNAHTFVLAHRGKFLFEMVEESDKKDIPIPGIDHSIFEEVLEYIYTVKQPKMEDIDNAKAILHAANRFGVTQLKQLAESTLAEKFLSPTTAAELLVLADSNSCALLKEAAMEVCVSNVDTVKGCQEWKSVTESSELVLELFEMTTSSKDVARDKDGIDAVDKLNVSTLRQRLEEANLDVDGTKQMLISRLKTYLGGCQQRSQSLLTSILRVRDTIG